MINTIKTDYLVLGAGISGLTFSKRISENGFSVLVLEKDGHVGGLSKSLYYKNFTLDYSAHRFHTNNKALLEEIMGYDGVDFIKLSKKSRIYMFGKYLKYPFELQNLLRAMPVLMAIKCGTDFFLNLIINKIRKKSLSEKFSYRDWFIELYGSSLYSVMCEPYTKKIWKTDPAKISGDWANQRFKTENLSILFRRILKKIAKLDFSGYSLEDEGLAPDGGDFYYPRSGGIQSLANGIKNEAIKNNVKFEFNVNIIRIDKKNKVVIYKVGHKECRVEYQNLISTIPLYVLGGLIEDTRLISIANNLKYMDISFVYLFINRTKISQDHWLYFPDENIIFNRAVEFSNWGDDMCPKGLTCVCFDITHFKDSVIKKMSDNDLIKNVIKNCIEVGYLTKNEVIDSLVIHVDDAYPFYDLDYKNNLTKAVNIFEDDSHFMLGRTGIFRYNNSDNSIEMGFELAERLKNNMGGILNYTIEKTSL